MRIEETPACTRYYTAHGAIIDITPHRFSRPGAEPGGLRVGTGRMWMRVWHEDDPSFCGWWAPISSERSMHRVGKIIRGDGWYVPPVLMVDYLGYRVDQLTVTLTEAEELIDDCGSCCRCWTVGEWRA